MIKKFYVASKGTNSAGILYLQKENKSFNIPFEPAEKIEGITAKQQVIYTNLKAINKILSQIDTKSLSNVCDIVINNFTYEIIAKNWYKYWLITGANSKGEPINEVFLNEIKNFYKLYLKKHLYIRFVDMNTARPNINLTKQQLAKLPFDIQCNYVFISHLWNTLSPKQEVNLPKREVNLPEENMA